MLEASESTEVSRSRRDICEEFADAPDLCISAMLPPFSKSVIFFSFSQTFLIGGMLPIEFGIKIGGEFSVSIEIGFCLLSLKVTVTPIPGASAPFEIYAAVGSCWVLCGGIKLQGILADVKFPVPAFIG